MSIVDRDLTTIAFCWRLERRDGICLGFTTHDVDLVIGGLVYRAAPGMLPSSISLSDGFDLDTLDVSGALTSDAISADDLMAGRWDRAAVAIFMIDWEMPNGGQVPLARGEFGDVSMSRDGFSVELRGPTAVLDQPVVEQTSPECRARLGDKRCRVDMGSRVLITRIVAIADEDTVDVTSTATGANAYAYGRLRWTGGANSGLESEIVSSSLLPGSIHRLKVRQPPPFTPIIGDCVEISEGCDKAFATCAARFANALNFRGEPHLPGMDLLTRYPGA